MSYYIAIVLLSLILQCVTVYCSFRLIAITGHADAWMLLSGAIATMAARRGITLLAFLSNPLPHGGVDFAFELVGVAGSAMMLAGVLLIKPLFLALRRAEEKQRNLADGLREAMSRIKVLKQMLPICSNCKKIRDDEGYWQSVEGYITANGSSTFRMELAKLSGGKSAPLNWS